MDKIIGNSGIIIEDNYWISYGDIVDLECPPNGKLLKADFINNSNFFLKFHEIKSSDELNIFIKNTITINEKYFPIIFLEINLNISSGNISFDKDKTNLGGTTIKNCIFENLSSAISYSKRRAPTSYI